MRQRARWAVVGVLLAAGWAAGPGGVPLYDGVGLPDEPYRFVPARSADALPATTASIELSVTAGRNDGGLVAISAEAGPQVTVYAPPKAFALPSADDDADIRVQARPVELERPSPPGEVESNVYLLSLTSRAGAVRLLPDAQSPVITLRGVTLAPRVPVVMHHRGGAGQPWRALATRKVGQHSYTADAPGEGEYVLVRSGPAGPGGVSARTLVVTGLVLGGLVLVGVRILSRRRA